MLDSFMEFLRACFAAVGMDLGFLKGLNKLQDASLYVLWLLGFWLGGWMGYSSKRTKEVKEVFDLLRRLKNHK